MTHENLNEDPKKIARRRLGDMRLARDAFALVLRREEGNNLLGEDALLAMRSTICAMDAAIAAASWVEDGAPDSEPGSAP